MKRILLVCVGMVVSITGLSLDVPDLSTFKDLTAIKDNTSFFAEDFEHPNPNWKLGKNCRIENSPDLPEALRFFANVQRKMTMTRPWQKSN